RAGEVVSRLLAGAARDLRWWYPRSGRRADTGLGAVGVAFPLLERLPHAMARRVLAALRLSHRRVHVAPALGAGRRIAYARTALAARPLHDDRDRGGDWRGSLARQRRLAPRARVTSQLPLAPTRSILRASTFHGHNAARLLTRRARFEAQRFHYV